MVFGMHQCDIIRDIGTLKVNLEFFLIQNNGFAIVAGNRRYNLSNRMVLSIVESS